MDVGKASNKKNQHACTSEKYLAKKGETTGNNMMWFVHTMRPAVIVAYVEYATTKRHAIVDKTIDHFAH